MRQYVCYLQSDDVWMRTHLQYVDLPPHLLRQFEVLDLAFIQDLHSHLQAGDDVMCDCSPSKG